MPVLVIGSKDAVIFTEDTYKENILASDLPSVSESGNRTDEASTAFIRILSPVILLARCGSQVVSII